MALNGGKYRKKKFERDGLGANPQVGTVISTKVPTTINTPMIGIGNYGTRVVDTSLADSLFNQSVVTACAKSVAGNSTCAGYFSANNTAATANARLQSVLAHTYLSGDCNDA